MACMECPHCHWMGNRTICPQCGALCVWDEAHTDRDDYRDDDDNDETQEEEVKS